MSKRIDHTAEAMKIVEATFNYAETDENTGAIVNIVGALTHATLALVEQQRIANLIALMDSPRTATSVARVAERALMEGEPVTNRTLRPDIAAALGIPREAGASDA